MEKEIEYAFFLLKEYFDKNNENNQANTLVFVDDLPNAFSRIALSAPLEKVYEIGTNKGFPGATITNMLILHGGYFRLLKEGMLQPKAARFIDSLYQPTFPSLNYNTKNEYVTAPWITLSAQEVLLDICLDDYTVIEYGSGISSFFFSREANACYSFETKKTDSIEDSWWNQMKNQSAILKENINLLSPEDDLDTPKSVIDTLWKGIGKLLVFIDGGDRKKHFDEWSQYIILNKESPVILLVDNSELNRFKESFSDLAKNGASIFHHYGSIYGQLINKSCSSFITYRSDLLVGRNSAPANHDNRWGAINFQL